MRTHVMLGLYLLKYLNMCNLRKINTEQNEKANFETAISETKFGKYNYLLLLCAIPAGMTPIIGNTVMSYVVPAAQCDLELSLQQKGALNSAVFIGMVISSYFWGIIGDRLGRKRILLIAYSLDLIFNILGAFMQKFLLVYILKFLSGFVVSASYALIIAYMSEFHSTKYRSKVVLMVGISMVTSMIFLPALAWAVMPLPNITILSYVLHPWQVFMLLASIPVLVSTIVFIYLPETPKFLMSTGKNEEAMKIFRKIYSWNTGNPEEKYPISQLNDEIQDSNTNQNVAALSNKNVFKLLQTVLAQLKPLFTQPHLLNIFLVVVIHFGILLGANTLRLWLPQIFTSIDEYNQIHGSENGTLCDVIEFSFGKNSSGLNITEMEEADCIVILPNNQVYINSIIIGVACLLGNIILILIINHCSKKYLLVVMVIVSGCAALGNYWSPNQLIMLVSSTINIVLAIISSTTLMSLVVELFPTSLRGVAVALNSMAGQLGALIGNLIFPYLLQSGCIPPFLFLGCIVIFCGLLCTTLPNPSGKDFK